MLSYVTALHARTPLTLYDPSQSVLSSALTKLDSLLARDVEKKRITQDVATTARELITAVQGDGTEGSKVVEGVDLVIEVGK
jgi:3-hydroxybutyryl-CoA dehydrogenase